MSSATLHKTCTYCGNAFGGHQLNCPVIRGVDPPTVSPVVAQQPQPPIIDTWAFTPPTRAEASKWVNFVGHGIVNWLSRFTATFFAGLLLVLLCYGYAKWKVNSALDDFDKQSKVMIDGINKQTEKLNKEWLANQKKGAKK